MTQQYLKQQSPSVKQYGSDGLAYNIDYIDVLEVSAETQARIATHPGEDGTVFADTRVVLPARYHAVIAFPSLDGQITDVHKNLLDASYRDPSKYVVTSYFSKGWNLMVVSSKHRDTPDMNGLRIQDVVFEECLEYNATGYELEDVDSAEDSGNQTQSAQYIED